MIWQLIFIVLAATALALAYRVVVERSYRRGVGIVAREVNGTIYLLSTQILDDAIFVPRDTPDDYARDFYRIDDRMVAAELLHRHAFTIPSPAQHVRISGLQDAW